MRDKEDDMRLVIDILRTKGEWVCTVHPDSSVYDALKLMAEKEIGALVVVENDQPIGIFSERDYARRVILAGRSSLNTKVREIMTEKVYFVRPEQTLEECMALMTQSHIRHLPVMNGQKLAGLISIGDIVKEIISDQNLEIQQLENYVLGRGYAADPLQK
jgi:signal-transduction protein with cAMP-binding, CBS, and nucleotidyltransferase domain